MSWRLYFSLYSGALITAFKIGWDHITSMGIQEPDDGMALHNPQNIHNRTSPKRRWSWVDRNRTIKPNF